MSKNKKYSVQFKLDAIELYLTTELFYREVANYLKMNNLLLIANWHKAYQKYGIDGLSKPKKSSAKMLKEKSKEGHSSESELFQLEKLKRENRMLKI